MPVRIPNNLPARKTLAEENIFVMTAERAVHQDIRPLRIAVLNLMPTKIVTETQLLRLLGNSPLQVDITFIRMGTHESKNTPTEHLDAFYESLDEVLHERFDGLVITGAPVETLPFDQVDYWPELVRLMDWSRTNVWSTHAHLLGGAGGAVPPLRCTEVPGAREGVRTVPAPRPGPHRADHARLRRGLHGPALAAHRGAPGRHRAGEGPEAARRLGRGRASTWPISDGRADDVRDGPPRVRQAHAEGGVRPRRGQGVAHRRAEELLPRR